MSGVIYPNSPLREAIFDVRFKFEKQPDLSAFDEIYTGLSETYPKKEVSNFQQVSFEMKAGQEPKINSTGGPNGLRLISNDGIQVAQFRTDGFTFSRLKPYQDWEPFIAEAKRLLGIYVEKLNPSYAERLALRYVNAIEIPESNFTLEDYFLTLPKISESLPQGLMHFFSRIVIKDAGSDAVAIVNQTVENSGKPDVTTVLFDIDTSLSNVRLDPNSGEFWAQVEVLKAFRTTIFEGSITEKTRTLFA